MTTHSIIKKSQLEGAKRIDAEYYQPEYLEIARTLRATRHETLKDVAKSLVSFGAYALTSFIEWREEGIPFITAENIMDGFVDYDGVRFIDEEVDEILKKSRVREGQVLLAMSGSVGNAAVAINIPPKLNSNQDIVKITPKDGFSPYVLAAFLNSHYGKKQILRLPVGSVQQHIFLWQMQTMLVPVFDTEHVIAVESLYKKGLEERYVSHSLYSQAENLLLEGLGLKRFKSDEDLYSVVNFSNTRTANRIDAEYFQPKYEKVVLRIKKNNARKIGDLAEFVGHATQSPYDDAGDIAVLAQTHMKDNLAINTPAFSNFTKEDLIKESDKKFILKKGDVLISSAGEPGLTCVWTGDYRGKVIPGSFVTIARFRKDIEPLYSGVFLNTIAGRLQFERDYTGSIQQYVYPSKIKEILIPVLPKMIQEEISDLVRKSQEARKKSKELLEEAKHKVEEMIENKGR